VCRDIGGHQVIVDRGSLIDRNDQVRKKVLFAIEFQTSSDPDLAARLLVYNAILYYENRMPVISLVGSGTNQQDMVDYES
jgi:hypothetical protein